jgi:hypothetical protein
MKGRREPPWPHCKSGPLSDDALYDEVSCRDVPLSPEAAEWQRRFIEDAKAIVRDAQRKKAPEKKPD